MASENKQRAQRSASALPVLIVVRCLSSSALLSVDCLPDRQPSGSSVQVPAEPSPDSGEQALQSLISGTISQDEVASFVEAVVLSRKANDEIGNLQRNDAQVIIDVLDKVPCHLSICGKFLDFDEHLDML